MAEAGTLPGGSSTLTYISDAEIAALVSMPDAIEALRDAFEELHAGTAATLERTRVVWDEGRLQALGGYLASSGFAAVKAWTVTESGAQPTLLLFSSRNGSLLGALGAVELGRLRTGAASGLATDLMAAPDAATLALVGTGKQAWAQAEAVLAVRPIDRVLVSGRDRERSARFAESLAEGFEIDVTAAATVAEAVAEADVVTTITSATEPCLRGEWLRPGAHVNAAGTILPTHAEADPEVFERAQVVAVDDVMQASREAGDLIAALACGAVVGEELATLAELVGGGFERQPEAITVFKSVGIGLEDVAVAALAWRVASADR